MTRKDHNRLAALVRDTRKFSSIRAHAEFAAEMAETLLADNPRFKPILFMDASKPTWLVGTTMEHQWDVVAAKFIPKQ